jgi:hypothetical protein
MIFALVYHAIFVVIDKMIGGALLGRVAGTLVFRPLDRDGRVISAHSRVKQSDRLVRANRPTRPS